MRFRTGTFLISWMRLGKPRKNVTCPGRTARTWAEAIDNEEALPGYSAVQPRDTFLLLCNQRPREMICTLREGEDCVCFAYHLWSFVLSPQQALINIWWVGERRMNKWIREGIWSPFCTGELDRVTPQITRLILNGGSRLPPFLSGGRMTY